MYFVKRKTRSGWECVPGMTFSNRAHAEAWTKSACALEIKGVLAYQILKKN